MLGVPFAISRTDWVATAGSCFAQQISRAIVAEGFRYLVTETAPRSDGAVDENYGVFPARFANLYTPRALLQLFQRAYGVFEPCEVAWLRAHGRWVDPFRPRIQAAGFETPAALVADREVHFAAVRAMFERANVFIFTMGLTEAWASPCDGAVFPLAAGVVAEQAPRNASTFVNFSVTEMTQDLLKFVAYVRRVNPGLRIILTVSPVPIIATFEPRHVLVSSVFTKSALRVVADEVSRADPGVVYFPSYEMVAGPQARGRFYADNLRAVTPEGVAFVMDSFPALPRCEAECGDGPKPTPCAAEPGAYGARQVAGRRPAPPGGRQRTDGKHAGAGVRGGSTRSRPRPGARMKIAIVGNCTVDTIAGCLRQLVDTEVASFWAQPSRKADAVAFRARLAAYDVVCTHPFAEGAFALDALRRDVKTVVVLPVLNFSGFHPGSVVIDGVRGVMGYMHSALVVSGYLLDLPPRRVLRLFNRFVYRSLGYFDRYDIEKRRLLATADGLGFDLATAFASWPRPFSYDLQHPLFEVSRSLAELLPSRLGLASKAVDWTDPAIRAVVDRTRYNVIWPVYPEIAVHLGLTPEPIAFRYKSRSVLALGLGEYIHRCYALYPTVERDVLERAVAAEKAALGEIFADAAA